MAASLVTPALVAKRLEFILDGQPFCDFYNGDFESYISGVYEKGTPKHTELENRVKDKLKLFATYLATGSRN